MRYLLIFTGLLFIAAIHALAAENSTHDSALVSVITNLKSLHLVTEEPHPMFDSTAALCRPPIELPHNLHEGFIRTAYCNVYVNETAKKTMISGSGVYPVDSLIVKAKLPDKDKPKIEIYTVMRKMPTGYDREHGDWEYSIVDGTSRRVFASGKIGSCIECHVDYRESDYVTRTYFENRGEPSDEPKSR